MISIQKNIFTYYKREKFLTIENSDPTYHNEEKLASKLIVVNLFASNAKTMPKTVIFLPFLAGWL